MTRAELVTKYDSIDTLYEISSQIPLAQELGLPIGNPATLEELETEIDNVTHALNYIEDVTDDNRPATKYDIRQAGSYICRYDTTNSYHGRETETKRELYREKLIDKWHTLLSLAYYIKHDLPMDFRPRNQMPTPVSACDPVDRWRYESIV